MAVQMQRQRTASLERWQKALQRAMDNGLEIFVVNDTGERMVTSASKLDTLYRTDARHCTCEAALSGDPVCQHRAIVRFVLGWLPAPAADEPREVAAQRAAGILSGFRAATRPAA